MAQERRSSQRRGERVIGLPGQRRGVQPRYGKLDWQTLPVDSTTAQQLWQPFWATETNAPDTVSVVPPTLAQQDTVLPPPPSVQQPTGTGVQAANTGAGTMPSATTPPASQPAPTPGAARKEATAESPQGVMQGQYQLASLSQQAQRIGIESAMQQVPVLEPVGAQIESGLTPDYTAELQNLIQQWFLVPFQQRGFNLWAAVPTTSGLDARVLLRQGLQFLKERLPQLSEQDAQLVSLLADDERLKDALLQESRRLLEEAIARTPAASHYQELVKILKKQEEELRRELLSIPPENRVMLNQHFVDLYNRYLQVQNNIMNAAALVAANQGWRINWQNLLDRAAANFLQPVWRILQSLELAVPVEQAVERGLRSLRGMAKDSNNPYLREALQYLGEIRKYGGRNLTLWESARIAQLHSKYVTALQQAGLDDDTVYALASVVTKPGTLPGLGWSSGPIVEPAQPIIGFLQPAQLSGAQLPNVEAPVPTSRGGGGRRDEPILANVRALPGFGRPEIDVRNLMTLQNSFARFQNVAGAAYIPFGDRSWLPILKLWGGGENSVIEFSGARFTPLSMSYDQVVANLRHILSRQKEGAYTAATKEDIVPYLDTLTATVRSDNSEAAAYLEQVARFFERYPGIVGKSIAQSVDAPVYLFKNFLRNLRNNLQGSKLEGADSVLQALQLEQVRSALRAALTAGIARYIALRLREIAVNGRRIDNSVLSSGIAGLVLGNLHSVVLPE